MSFNISGIGTAVPPNRIAQDDAARLAHSLYYGQRRERMLSILYRRTTIEHRHSVLLENPSRDESIWQTFYPPARNEIDRGPTTEQRMARYDAEAGPLATVAAGRALQDAGVSADEITHLITVSCTGFAAPGVDMTLIETLGLSAGVSRTNVGFMGCHGALNAMRTAAAFSTAQPDASVLVCAVELCSLHQQYGWSPDNAVANALFADGAAAVLGHGDSRTTRPEPGLSLLASGSTRLEGCSDFMTWRIGNHGFEMTLSTGVPDMIREHLWTWLTQWLSGQGMTLDQVGAWAIHPGGPRILSACAEVLGLTDQDMAPSRAVLEGFGNMSSPTVLFIADRLRKTRAPLPWVLLGFGPGLAIEAALLGQGGIHR